MRVFRVFDKWGFYTVEADSFERAFEYAMQGKARLLRDVHAIIEVDVDDKAASIAPGIRFGAVYPPLTAPKG